MKPSEETIRRLGVVVEHFEEEEKTSRDRQILLWRKLKLMWDGFTEVYYSEVAHDWRLPPEESVSEEEYYDKPINIFRAYLESIIAALSVVVPPVKCIPDDADNSLDLSTAKAGDKIAKLIYQHNDVSLLWLHALYVFCTEGMVACYNYSQASFKNGTYTEPMYEDSVEIHEISECPQCQYQFDDSIISEGEGSVMTLPEICPQCQQEVLPNVVQTEEEVTRLIGITEHPKSRQCLEVHGGLSVKIPNYAKNQKGCPYLFYYDDVHFSEARHRYPDIRDKISEDTGSTEEYGAWGRLSSQLQGEPTKHNVTIRKCWLRPSAFEVLAEEECKFLKKKYPNGVRVTYVDEEFAEAISERLDDHWTLTHNPLSDYIHHDPLGLLLTAVQEITSDLVSLIEQTIEHGIPQTFADPNVLNFKKYGESSVKPGTIYPATPKGGRAMQDSFYEVKTATLSAEVLPFLNMTQTLGQTVSGALPSLFGGQLEGSKTASEYSMSRSQALQRLQTTWKMLTIWWKNIFGKAIVQYIEDVKDDEKFVEKDKYGNFVNNFIYKADLEGKIGNVELEANENLPITWTQFRDSLMKMMEMNNPIILKALTIPQNLPVIREALGLTGFVIPGEDDRNKQYEEIQQLVNSEPLPGGVDEMGMPTELPSVEIEEFDNDQIELEVCIGWIVGEAGRLAKVDAPLGYRNVLLHARQHQQRIQERMMQQQAMMQPPSPDAGAPTVTNELNQEAPIVGDANVSTE